jgi:hypothetical protein
MLRYPFSNPANVKRRNEPIAANTGLVYSEIDYFRQIIFDRGWNARDLG